MESARINTPMLIGFVKPLILIPAGLLASLPPEQVEAVLLHELAHIRRNDYLVNLVQGLVESIFFFNPGLLWLSALLREEREHCCDELALEQIADKMTFVQALISFKEHAIYRNRYPLAFLGARDQLLSRINRIVGSQIRATETGKIRTLGYVACFLILMLAMLLYVRVPVHTNSTVVVHQKAKMVKATGIQAALKTIASHKYTSSVKKEAGRSNHNTPAIEIIVPDQHLQPANHTDQPIQESDQADLSLSANKESGYESALRRYKIKLEQYTGHMEKYHAKIDKYHEDMRKYNLEQEGYQKDLDRRLNRENRPDG